MRRPTNSLQLLCLGLCGCAVLIGYTFGPTLAETARICWENEDYSHGILLPFITIYLLWERRTEVKRLLSCESAPVPFSFLGLLLLIVGLGILFVGTVADLLYIRWVGFFPAVLGGLFLIFGPRVSTLLAGPFLLNFMAKPVPDALVPQLFFPLQVLAARCSAHVLEVLNVPVHLMGNVIEIPGMTLMVEQACSGMRSVFALMTVSLIVLISVRMTFFGKTLVLLTSLAVAIGLNILRVAITGVLAHFYDRRAAEGFFHSFSGMIVFIVGLAIVYGIGRVLERWFRPVEGAEQKGLNS